MEQTSKLSIVVNTQTAQKQLAEFRSDLRLAERSGQDLDRSLSKIGSKTQFAGLVASLKSAQSTLLALSGTAKNSVSAMDAFNVTAKNLSANTKNIANNLNTSQAAMARFANSSKSVGSNLQTTNAAIAQTQTNLMKIIGSFNFATTASGKLSISAKTLKADIAALNASLATGSGALGRFGQASNAAGAASSAVKAQNTELANSYRLVNTGLQSNAQYLQQANRALSANSSASVAAQLNQDKLAISSSKVATAASRAAEASTRAQIATVNLANASSRASAAISDEASAAARAAAANSNAAAAATRAASATSNLAAANSRADAALSGAAAAASRAAGASSSAAAAASRAAAAVSGEAAARERATAAASRAAAAAANAAAAQDRASTAALRLAAAEARAAADADRLSGALNRTNAQGRGLMGTLTSLQGVLTGGLFAVTGLGILKTADEMQNLNSQIKIVTNSEREYLAVREKVREIANQNYGDVKATTSLYATSARALANLGKSQQDTLDFTNAVSLAMRTGGRSAQEQASAILQLSQSMGANVVQGDEFRSIAENAPILLELVAKRLGVLPGQLKALAADGIITGEVMYDALTQNVNMLEEMAKKMPLTMSQAFAVAKNRYKAYVDGMMNETGGLSSKIASSINGISANFDTLAKVAIAGAGIAFAQLALSIGTASNAMAIFNAISRANPLILIASGFLAVNSAIFGVNEVLTISGIVVGDFFDAMGVMLNDAETGWNDFSDTVAKAMGITVKEVADANDKNSKNFLGFYEKTEKGFAGVVQGIGSSVSSVTAIFGTFFTTIENWVLNTLSIFDNMGRAAHNAGNAVRTFFGGDDNSVEYTPYANKTLNPMEIYSGINTKNQDYWRDYAKSLNKRALPKAKTGEYDPNYVAPIRSSLIKNNFSGLLQGGQGVLANRPAGLPDILRNNQISNLPMDELKKSQFEQVKSENEIEEAKKAAAKAAKERAKLEREATRGLSDRLVGVSGDTGIGSAHLHIQYRDKSRAVSPADLDRFRANGKRITDYPMTSGYGKRNTGIKGASTNHKGTDFAIPKNTGITTNVAVKSVKTWQDSKGGGYVSTITFEDGVVIDLLHQMPSVMGVEKGSSTGNRQIDNMVGKAENEVAKAAAKAEKERIRQAEEAQRERERIAAIDLKLLKEYGDKELQLTIEHDARVAEINESSFNGAKKAELIAESERRMKQEFDVYKKGLDDRVNEFAKYKQTERDILKQQYNDDVFGIMSDPVLSRPENKQYMTEALANAKALNEYRVSLYEQSLEQEKSAMYAFQKTERQILIDEGVARLANAKLQQDELSAYRVDAVEAEEAYKLTLFDTNHALQMLDLKKSHMSQMQYIREKYDLEKQLVGLSNATPETKALQLEALRAPAKDALKGMLEGIEQQSPMAKIRAEYEANLLILEEYEQKYTDMIGVQTEARLAIEQSYMNAKRDLFLTQGEDLFGALAGLSKSFVGEQATTYRLLYGIQKGFAVASAGIALWQSVSEASKAPIPAKWGLMAAAAADGAKLVSTITSLQPQGFKQGGYTGNMGASQVAGVVHGQEYVFDAQATKRIGVDNLNAMRSGKAPTGGDVNITVNNMSSAKVETQKDDNGNIVMTIRDEIKRSWTNTGNPNSFESKQLNRNLQAPRRR